MAWEKIIEREQYEVRCDKTNRNIMVEVNSGGLVAEYITLHLGLTDVDELIAALQHAKEKIQ